MTHVNSGEGVFLFSVRSLKMGGSSGGSHLNFLAPEEYQSASRSWGEVPWADDREFGPGTAATAAFRR